MPKGGGSRMKMRVPNMAGGGAAFQAQMARMQQQMMQSAAVQQEAVAEHTGTVARDSFSIFRKICFSI